MSNLNITINATNNTTTAFSSLSNSASTAFRNIQTASNNASRSMASNTTSAISTTTSSFTSFSNTFQTGISNANSSVLTLGNSIKSVGGTLTKTLTVPLTALGILSTKSAADGEETWNKFEVVFGDLTEETKEWADAYADATSRAHGDMYTYLADLQNLTVGFGATREEGAKMSKEMVELGMNLASFNNLNDKDAIDAVSGAMMGQTERAKSLGAVLNETTQAMTMERMGITKKFDELSELEKIQVRYQTILGQSMDAEDDAIETAGSFTNSLKGLKGAITDTSSAFGEVMLPMLTELLQHVAGFIKWLGTLDEGTRKILVTVGLFLAVLGPILSFVGGLIIKITMLSSVMTAFGLSITAVLGPVAAVIAVITALIMIVPLIIKNWDKISAFFVSLFDGLKSVIKGFLDFVGTIFSMVLDVITAPFRAAYSMIAKVANLAFGTNLPEHFSFTETFAGSNLPSYDVGTNYVSKDQVAMIHEGEAIVPKKYNPSANGSTGAGNVNVTVYLDGDVIAKAVAPRTVKEIRLRTGAKH